MSVPYPKEMSCINRSILAIENKYLTKKKKSKISNKYDLPVNSKSIGRI